MTKRRRGRELALRILYGWDIQREEIIDFLQKFWKAYPCKQEIISFCEILVNGVVKQLAEIDALIVRFAKNWDIDRMSLVDKNIMRIATYELTSLRDIPCSVTINEAIEIAKKYGSNESGAFINGILDKIRIDSER